MLEEQTIANFWSRKTIVGECWLWTRIGPHHKYPAGQPVEGYGVFYHEGMAYPVHRLAYELTYGPIPEDLCVCHRCDTPACFNPAHLFLGTDKDNMRDKINKGRYNLRKH